MSQKRIRLTPITASVSFTEISPSKRRRRKKCIALPLVTTSTLVNADSEVEEPEFDAEEPEIDSPDSSQQARSYPLRQEKLCEAWSEIREQLRRVLIESNVSGIGNNCSTCDQKALIICQQCGPQVAFCEECTELRHLTCNLFHHPQLFKDDVLIPYKFKNPRVLKRNDHHCPNMYSREITCLDETGYQHAVSIRFCKCEAEAVTLARFHMWPCTPSRPTLAFHQDLLLWMESIILEGCIGVDAFCRALQHKVGSVISQQFSHIYPAIIDAFEEFKFIKYELSTLEFIAPELNTKVICPACPKEEGTKIFSFDALFGLCRKKHAGVSVRPPLYDTTFFESQSDVDRFVRDYDSPSSSFDKGCHHFLAGDCLRSKGRFAALDETAVFGSICRHEFPQRFISLKHGERLAYASYMLEQIKKNNHLNYILLYDIACTLHKHLKSHGRQDLLEGVTLGIPAFHVYGHCAKCQLSYSPRVLSGCGLTDGEATERLWSYLRRLSKMTKEMRPSHRIDVLTSGILHYAAKTSQKLAINLPKRLNKAKEMVERTTRELSEITDRSGGTLTLERIEELSHIQASSLLNDVPTSYGQRHKLLQQILHLSRQRKFLLLSKSRYADGQSIALRLAKQIASTTESIKRAISKFNNHSKDQFEGTLYNLPQSLQWCDIFDLEGMANLELSSHSTVSVDTALLNRAVRILHMNHRAQEEIRMVKEDMKRTAEFYAAEHSLLHSHLDRIRSGIQSVYNKGCLNLLSHRLVQCEFTLTHCAKAFVPHISFEFPLCSLIFSLFDSTSIHTDTISTEDISVSSNIVSSDSESSTAPESDSEN